MGEEPTPTQSASALLPGDAGWTFVGDPFAEGLDGQEVQLDEAASNDGTSVVTGRVSNSTKFSGKYAGGMTWSSADGRTWTHSDFWNQLANGPLHSLGVAAFSSGFVAYAVEYADQGTQADTRFFISSDGQAWQEAGRIAGWEVTRVAAADDLLIAIAMDWHHEHGSIWYSSDGRSWQQSADPNADLVGLRATAVTATDSAITVLSATDSDAQLWRTPDGEAWAKWATLPDSPGSDRAYSFRSVMAVGPNGWSVVAIHETDSSSKWYAWHSFDGADWVRVQPAPHDVQAIVASDDGFVAAGHEVTGSCCAYASYEIKGITWWSPDGLEWHRVKQSGWKGRELDALLFHDGVLLGLGVEWSPDEVPSGALWLADPRTFADL